MSDLKNYRIGATGGYTYTKEFWDAAESKQLTIDVATTDRQNFQKLLSGRIDIFPSGLVSGHSVLQKEFDKSASNLISFNSKPLSETTGHLLFPKTGKKSENLLQVFNQGLAKIKKKGIYNKFTDDLLAGKYSQ